MKSTKALALHRTSYREVQSLQNWLIIHNISRGFHEPLGRLSRGIHHPCAQGLVQQETHVIFQSLIQSGLLAWAQGLVQTQFLHEDRCCHAGGSLRPSENDQHQSKPFFIKFESYKPQSLHHESEYSRTAEYLREGFPFQSVTVLSNEGSVHLIFFIIRVLRIILVILPEHPSDTKVFTVKMEILLEPTSNKLMMEMEIPYTNKIKFITACSFSNNTLEDIMKAQVSVFKASATLNIQAFKIKKNTMADVNVNAPTEQAPAMKPPTRTDDQIVTYIRWVPVGKSNCYLDVDRSQSNLIYKITVDILKHTNFFRAFIASSTIPSIYIQQFWDIITPVDNNNAFTSPPTPNALIKFVNDLGYPKVGKKKATLIVIPSVRFTKLIVYYLQSKHKFYPRPGKQYYNAYLEKVAKHQRYLVGEEVSDPDSPAPKPAKATKPKALVTETSEAPSPAKRCKAGKVTKKRKPKSYLQLIDEGFPDKEPLYGDEEADTQREIEESLKEVHGAHRGPLPPVVFRKPNSGKFQPLPEVQDQYIFQRRTSTQNEPSCHDESSLLYAELGLTDSEIESDEELLPVIQSRAQDEGQAGPNPGIQDEGQVGSNLGDAAVSQHQSSHAENLKLPTEDQVRVEELVSSAGTLSSLQNLDKELSFADQFLVEKSQEDEPEKTNTESEVQSMVTVPIHQDTSFFPLMTTPVIDLTVSQPVSTTIQASLPTSTATLIGELEQHMADMVEANQALEERLDKQGNRLYNLENLDIPHKVSKAVDEIVTDAVNWAIQAPLRDRFRDLPEADIKEN
ncbi:hypothetical protein Tco_1113486 [Tanacetum coccineum]|uniref:Uncharacterized protein n=1 Tax=Tanacetum coccineum TaxID=301880 RepID=A0ABQ5IV18_9ASTR